LSTIPYTSILDSLLKDTEDLREVLLKRSGSASPTEKTLSVWDNVKSELNMVDWFYKKLYNFKEQELTVLQCPVCQSFRLKYMTLNDNIKCEKCGNMWMNSKNGVYENKEIKKEQENKVQEQQTVKPEIQQTKSI